LLVNLASMLCARIILSPILWGIASMAMICFIITLSVVMISIFLIYTYFLF
jgi:hypothetical protein